MPSLTHLLVLVVDIRDGLRVVGMKLVVVVTVLLWVHGHHGRGVRVGQTDMTLRPEMLLRWGRLWLSISGLRWQRPTVSAARPQLREEVCLRRCRLVCLWAETRIVLSIVRLFWDLLYWGWRVTCRRISTNRLLPN